MAFSFMFWNVEKFGGATARSDKVQAHIEKQDPDLFCLCEIYDKAALRNLIMDRLTDYDFAVTDGIEGIELLAGWKRNAFQQILFTQRREFKAGSKYLRPGSLLTVRHSDEYYNFLFLHTDSGRKSSDYNNRQEMYEKVWDLRDKLNQITNGNDAKFITLGDLNTMGRSAYAGNPEVTADEEITNLGDDAKRANMTVLKKTHDHTLAWGRYGDDRNYRLSNLDHVIATDNLQFEDVANDNNGNSKVRVSGWVDLQDPERTKFIEEVSDHCSIFAKIS